MASYQLTLTNKREIAAGTMAFHFAKPAGFVYQAGQTADFTLIDPPETDSEGNMRIFSFASAPCEDELMVATRMRDTAFKRVLKGMQLGDVLEMDGPHGAFTLHRDAGIPAVFLTGGIGVTPVRSIVRQAMHERLAHRIVVFYSNTTPEAAAFLDELATSHPENPHYTFVGTMTRMAQSARSWDGELGYLSKAMLEKTLDDLSRPIYYIDGPRGMVAKMREILTEAGVDEGHIRTEEFSGY